VNAYYDRESESQLAHFSLLCSNLGWIIFGSAMSALFFTFAINEPLSLSFRLSWFTAVCAIMGIRLAYLRQWRRIPANVDNVSQRLRIATVLSCAVACCFGVFAFLAVTPEEPVNTLLVTMVLTGLVASATATFSYLRPMFLLTIFPMVAPFAMRFLSFGDASYTWIAILLFAYLATSVGTSRNIRASIIRSIESHFDNKELLESLKHQHQRAEASLAREEKANLAKSRFLAAASHDLRQPLHSLRLFTATLESRTRNSEHTTLVGQINSSVRSLEELFNALLDISKLDAGVVESERQHVYLDRLLTLIKSEFTPMAVEKNLHFQVQLDDYVVDTDVLLLDRLLRNLVSNAIRYTHEGEVVISCDAYDGRVWISVKDTGIGIPDSDQSRIFEEFVQVGNTERDRTQGIGLGLSIVKRLSDLLDVELKVESTPGEGAIFRIGVPEGDVALCQNADDPEVSVPDYVDSRFVLVIDDEEEACLAMEGLLESWGCIVMSANSGDAAVRQLSEIDSIPDIVISDYRLRDIETGGDVIKRIRSHCAFDIPAIILTGDIAPERLIEIQALGYPLLHKPCEPNVLRQLIARETLPLANVEKRACGAG
jgi:signal transduction histidine kinase